MTSYGKSPTRPDLVAKEAARDDLRSFSSNKYQRRCGVQPLSTVQQSVPAVRFSHRHGRYISDKTIGCGSRHTCPTCTTPFMAGKRTEIYTKAAATVAAGGTLAYGVFTLPKRGTARLSWAHERLRTQCERFRRRMKIIELRYGIQCSTRVYEETYSEKTGWHPHANFVWYLPPKFANGSFQSFKREALAAWLTAAQSAGIKGTAVVAQHCEIWDRPDPCNSLARYLTKHSYYPPKAPVPASDGTYEGLQPWEILELARPGDGRWRTLWRKYEQAVKGITRVQHFTNNPPATKPPAESMGKEDPASS